MPGQGGMTDRRAAPGTSAKLACLAADGKLAEGEGWVQESLIGSTFECRISLGGSCQRRDRADHHRFCVHHRRERAAPGSARPFLLGYSGMSDAPVPCRMPHEFIA